MEYIMQNLFFLNKLSLTLSVYVITLGTIIARFSWRYMRGDSQYAPYLKQIIALVTSVLVIINANNIFLFGAAWISSCILMVKLIQHKSRWKQAKHSGQLARRHLLSACAFIGIGLAILAFIAQQNCLLTITKLSVYSQQSHKILFLVGIICVIIGAFIQSALIPFQSWLISSANAPTPTSALMHAGIVNGGGIILIRLANLYADNPFLLKILFFVGLLSAITGTLAKLVQSDIKRMLAFSTVSQMGFMMLECGLGLFSIAVAHICWHGFFKAYLFLSAGNTPHTPKAPSRKDINWHKFFLALFIGFLGVILFETTAGTIFARPNSSLVLLGLAFIFFSEIALTILENEKSNRFLSLLIQALCFVFLTAIFYGAFVRFIEWYFEDTHLSLAQPLDVTYIIGIAVFIILWFFLHLVERTKLRCLPESLQLKIYVWLINFSQPASKTITSFKTHYQF